MNESIGGGTIAPAVLGEREFGFLRDLIMRAAGIHLTDQKRSLVEGRLARRLRHHGLRSFREYTDLLREQDADGRELLEFVNCITTNKTSFFREQHHFDFLRDEVIAGAPSRALRIWSAACSTGEEPYSIAMTVRDARATATILASDIDTNVLATARAGVYTAERVASLDHELVRRHFRRGEGERAGWYKVRPELQKLIDFRRVNLIEGSWPSQDTFDVIFCRNVVIYFNRETQEQLFRRFAERLVPGGFLILGHSENLSWMSDVYAPVGRTIYQLRRGSEGAGSAHARHAAHGSHGSHGAHATPATHVHRPKPKPAHPVVRIEAGGVHAARVPTEIRTVLGSCVAACLYDPILKIGGMNHFMLPHGHHETRPARYGVHAMELLINEIMKLGGDRLRLRAKVFGGANVIAALRSGSDVGKQNADFIRTFLRSERIPIEAERLGGVQPLEVRLHTESGRVRVRALQSDLMRDVVRQEERTSRHSLEVPAVVQDVDAVLF
jgi:chemotaxis protein methyltransferase CheR